MPHAIGPVRPDNPGDLGFPTMMVYELALADDSPKVVAEAYGFSREAFEVLIAHPRFIAAYEQARREVMEPGGILRVKALLISEAGLKPMYDIIHDKEAATSARIEAMKVVNSLAGVGQKAGQVTAPGTGFSISIDLRGAGEPHYVSRGRTLEHAPGASGAPGTPPGAEPQAPFTIQLNSAPE